MVAGERQPGNDDIRVPAWRDRTRRQRIAHDSVVRLRVERALIERDSRATGIAALGSRTEATDHVGMTVAFGILERHQESPGGRFVVSVVASAPGIDINNAIRRDGHMASVPEIVREHGRTEAW